MKTIILTEEQVKKVIGNIINEETPKSKTSSMIKQFNIANSFNSGQFQLNTTEQIDVAINEINQIILKSPNVKYDVVITSSESKVPNRGVGLKPGELSTKRGQAAELYIKEKLGDKIGVKVNNLGAQGPEWNPSNRSDDPQYTKYQYVTVSLVVSAGEETSDTDICNFKFTPKKGVQGTKDKNYVTLNKALKGKGQITITSGSIPDRMVVTNTKGQVVKDTGYVATDPHRYTNYKYVPMYVAGLTRLLRSSSTAAGKLITFKANTFNDVMKNLLMNPETIPSQQEMITDGREVSDGVESLKDMFDKGVRVFAVYQITSGSTTLDFDTSLNDYSVMVMSPLGQTGYAVTGKC